MRYFREAEAGVFMIGACKHATFFFFFFFPVIGLYLCCLLSVWNIFISNLLMAHSTSSQASA